MSRSLSRTTLSLASGLGLALAAASGAQAAQRCTGFTAISANSAEALCACTTVTPGFLRAVQGKHRFPALLAATTAQCPGMANLLSDLPTAAPALLPADDGDDNYEQPAAEEAYEEPEDDECDYAYDDYELARGE